MSGGRMQRVLGGVLVAAGLLLLLATGAYYANGLLAKSTLDDLETVSERPSLKTLDPKDNPAPMKDTAVPAPTKTTEAPRKDTVATVQDEPLREEPEPQIAAVTVTAPADSPVAETLVSSTGPGNASVATEPAARKVTLKPVVVRESAEPVVISRVNPEPVVVRVAAEIIRVHHVDATAPSRTTPSAASSQWDWRGVRDTSDQGQFRDDEVARVGPSIAYVSPVEKSAPGPETPAPTQVQTSTDTSGNGEAVTENVVVTPTDDSKNSEPVTDVENVAITPTDDSKNSEPVTENVAVTPTDDSKNDEPVTENVAITPTDDSNNDEPVTENVAITPTDDSNNDESVTENVAITPTDDSKNDEPVTENVAVTPTDDSDNDESVTENVALTPVDPVEALVASHSQPGDPGSYDTSAATSMHIPAIGLTSGVRDLQLVFNGQSSAWETPDKIVGHIPTTAKPGASGQGWYFGHLDSPVRGEGNVFRYLPKIPELTKNGPVYIFLETESHSYAYQVYKTKVVHHTQLAVSDSGQQDITLVTCVPRFYYDHRLLVTAALVGVKPNQPQSG